MQSIQKWPTDDNFNPNGHGTDGGETAPVDSGAERRHAQKMEALGRLACGVAHDFNNLLTVIGGYAQLLLQRGGEQHDMRNELLQIHRASERAAAFSRQLLTFGSKHSSRMEIVCLNDLTSEYARLLRPLVGEDIEIRTTLTPVNPRINAHSGHLLQILLNLAANARDAMPGGGHLTFETAIGDHACAPDAPKPASGTDNPPMLDAHSGCSADCMQRQSVISGEERPQSPWVVLTIRDTGQGMDPRLKGRIFEPFFSTKSPGRGTGLGLAMVAELVYQMGGRIKVESHPGAGTAFSLWFPGIDKAVQPAVREMTYGTFPGGPETILLVEDAEYVRNLLQRVLTASGYKVLTASSGAEAIGAAAATPIDLLITDVVLPRMDGLLLAEQLTATQPRMRVLFVSGYPASVMDRVGRNCDADALLQKPFTPEILLCKVREILS